MKKSIIILLSYYLLQGIIHNLGHPITPSYVDELNIEKYMFGFFFAGMSFGQVLGAPFWGLLGDKRGKRTLIVMGLVIYSVGQVLFAVFTNPVLLVFARILAGFGVSAHITLVLSHLIAKSPEKDRTKFIAWSAALFAVGTTFGYQIGGMLSEYMIKEVFFVQAAVNIGLALFIAFTIGNDVPEEEAGPVKRKAGYIQSFKNIKKLNGSLLVFLLALTLTTISASTLTKYFDVYVIDQGYTPRQLGNFIFVTGIAGLLTNIFITPKLARLNKDRFIMKIIQVISALIVFYVFRQNALMLTLYTVFIFYFILKNMFQPFEQSFISKTADRKNYGTIMGIRQSFFMLGNVIGPIISGFIYDYNPLRMFDVSAFMFLGAFILMIVSERMAKRESSGMAFKIEPETA